MCLLNFSPYNEDSPDYPFPRARPRVAWALPVNMNKLGASLQALTDSSPQITTLRLCHKFRHGPLSKLPQELLEHIVDNVERAARAKCLPGWYHDSVCWQGTCRHEDHYNVYGEDVEKLWQKIFVDKAYGRTYEKNKTEDKTEAEKVEMVHDWVSSDPSIFDKEEGFCLHFDAIFRWLDRCCTCPQAQPGDTRNLGSFRPMNKVCLSMTPSRFSKCHRSSKPDSDSKQSSIMKPCRRRCSNSFQTTNASKRMRTTLCAILFCPRSQLAPLLPAVSVPIRKINKWRAISCTLPFARSSIHLRLPSRKSSVSASLEP